MIFGVVDKYINDRGFGFINCLLPEAEKKEIFFHITAVESSSILKNAIESQKYSDVYFWFDVEINHKGKRLKKSLAGKILKKIENS